MLRFVNICLVLGLVALAYVIYEVKYQARGLDEEIAGLSKDIEAERDGVAVLRAEWSLLNRPERIERLAQKYLKLAPARATQLVTLDTVSEGDFALARVKAADQTVAAASPTGAVPAKAAQAQTAPAATTSTETVLAATASTQPVPAVTAPAEKAAPATAALADAAPDKTATVETATVKTATVKTVLVKTAPVRAGRVKTVKTVPVKTVKTVPVRTVQAEAVSAASGPVKAIPAAALPPVTVSAPGE
jgi:cell division protein FtsL